MTRSLDRTRPRRSSWTILLVALLVAAIGLPATSFAATATASQSGTLQVETEPTVEATILVDGVARNTGAVKGLELAAGAHEVCFGSVEGYQAPPCEVVEVEGGDTVSVVGEFTPTGRVDVSIEPAGLQPVVTIAGVERDRGAVTVDVEPGTHDVCFEDVADYHSVPCRQVSVEQGGTTTVSGTYELDVDPVAKFEFEPAEPVTGETVTFDASSSRNATSFTWDDASPGDWPMGEGAVLEFTYRNPGKKLVRLTVADDDGNEDSVVHEVVVAEADSSEADGSDDATDDDVSTVSHGTELARSDAGLPSGWSGRSSGAITTTRDGQVIEGFDVSVSSGVAIAVEHDNVVVRNNRVNHRNGANGIVVASSVSNVTVEHNDLEGHNRTNSGNFGSIGVLTRGENITVRRNHFRGGRDGIHLYGTNSQAVENWVSHLHQHSGAHNDSVVYGGRTNTYANNTIARNRAIAGNSGGIDLYAMYGPIQGVDILDNLIVGNDKGWGIYGGYAQPLSGKPNYHHHNRDIRIEGNRFTPRFGWPVSRGEGSNAAVNTSQPGNTYKNNRWVNGTTDLQARCGVRQNNCES
jgi:hypothetical protein